MEIKYFTLCTQACYHIIMSGLWSLFKFTTIQIYRLQWYNTLVLERYYGPVINVLTTNRKIIDPNPNHAVNPLCSYSPTCVNGCLAIQTVVIIVDTQLVHILQHIKDYLFPRNLNSYMRRSIYALITDSKPEILLLTFQ